ncbi:GNAT family N-acetyltransferase [Aquimarina agarilytica]|uniref:GNAT family N-acetyltransferase n=1 Tax=Aquimarina agarilytica TaxID=1087449 RepID=UPI000289A7BA|nr:GNAT family N-acetyltransferase [Aquimarina agarilytica]
MIVRFVKEQDVTEVVKLCELHAAFEKTIYSARNKSTLLSTHFFNKESYVNCLVVEVDKEIVGYATFMKQFSTWDANFYMYLDCLFLKENVRGKGLGALLMQKIKDHAVSQNCTEIQWQTPDFNKRAITFYKKLGAQSKTKERFFWPVP